MSHGIREDEASKLIINGFIEPIIKELRWNTPSR
jgi:Fe-S cluster assembly scaffold protein SufB